MAGSRSNKDQNLVAVYIGLGSNVGNRENNLQSAVTHLAFKSGLRVVKISPVYETKPVGVTNQRDFLNAVVKLTTSLSPKELLKTTKEVENSLGRARKEHWGPRTIDLDILLFNQQVIREDNLNIPHPEIISRAFVLVPLADIAPELIHPVAKKTIKQLLEELPSTSGVKLHAWQFRQFSP